MMSFILSDGHGIAPRCPVCGCELRVYGTGQLVCTLLECPRPTAAAELLSEGETEHILVLEPGSYSLKHPIRERLDDALLTCWVGQHVGEFGFLMGNGDMGDWRIGTRYRVWMDGEGEDANLDGEELDG